VAEPHFAFVFPIEGMDTNTFIQEIHAKANRFTPFDIEIRCATMNKDIFLDYYHLLLVPDKGYSNVVKLHDILYSGILSEHLRLDVDFIPHMGIANARDPVRVKAWADHWNQKDFCISGKIDALTVVDYNNLVINDLEEVKLS